MLKLIRTDSTDVHFQKLVSLLNNGLVVTDGDEFEFFAQYNKLDSIKHVVVGYIGNVPVGCGAIKEYSANVGEIKRMFVDENFRGRRIAADILSELEKWAKELQFQTCILETSVALPSAIQLYEREGYSRIENYGQYVNVASSICMSKKINQQLS